MSKADFYRELVEDVESLVIAGERAVSAMTLIALQDDDVDGATLRTWVLKKHHSEDGLEVWARKEAERLKFARIAHEEVEKCRKREGAYAGLGVFWLGAHELLVKSVAISLGRSLTEHEIWKIEDLWDPWLSELKLAHKAHVTPTRKLSIGD